MTARRRMKELTIEVHPEVLKLLKRLTATGLWGFTVEQTAEELMRLRLRQELPPRPLRKPR